jgi:flagellar biosynthesis protein FlhF
MEVKRFFSDTMQDVLKMVREDLGPDAVILSNTKVEGGIEVVAALDYEEDISPDDINEQLASHGEPSPSQLARMHAEKHIKLQKEMESARRKIEGVRAKKQQSPRKGFAENTVHSDGRPVEQNVQEGGYQAQASLDAQAQSPWGELSHMRAEIMEIRGLLKNQPSNADVHIEVREKSIVHKQIEKKVDSLSFSSSIKKKLLGLVDSGDEYEAAWQKIERNILSSISQEQEDLIDRGGVVALVGPTGSGKTMTIGKMAARYVMKYGSGSIAMVTTDRYRIAAHEQLKVFGRILNVPVHTVDESHCLDSILDNLRDKKLVLIDTAGLMHSDACWSEQLQELKMSPHQIDSYLVISSVGQYQVMCSNYHNYKVVGLSGAIVTKVDEAVSLGEVLSFLIDTGLKAGYFTDGQRVPEDIHVFNANDILGRAQSLLNSSERWVSISSDEKSSIHDTIFSHSA